MALCPLYMSPKGCAGCAGYTPSDYPELRYTAKGGVLRRRVLGYRLGRRSPYKYSGGGGVRHATSNTMQRTAVFHRHVKSHVAGTSRDALESER